MALLCFEWPPYLFLNAVKKCSNTHGSVNLHRHLTNTSILSNVIRSSLQGLRIRCKSVMEVGSNFDASFIDKFNEIY